MVSGLRKITIVLVLAGAWWSVGKADAAPSPEKATALVEELHSALLASMKSAASTPVSARAENLRPVVESGFGLARMARFAVGSGWSKMTGAQRAAYVKAFSDVTVATYANRFDGYSGESFFTLGTQAGPQGSLLVATELRRPKDDPVALTYVIFGEGDNARIVDIYLDGSISELARQRSEYQSVMRRSGADALIDGLDAKARRLLAGNG
jgi:phospholipid transport system substrate-binding protein